MSLVMLKRLKLTVFCSICERKFDATIKAGGGKSEVECPGCKSKYTILDPIPLSAYIRLISDLEKNEEPKLKEKFRPYEKDWKEAQNVRKRIRENIKKKMKILVLGPGKGDPEGYELRKKVRDTIQNEGIKAYLPEDLPDGFSNLREKEFYYSRSKETDLVIILLTGPGSIAELSDFYTDPIIFRKLRVFHPLRLFTSRSYISEGPVREFVRISRYQLHVYEKDEDLFEAIKFELNQYLDAKVFFRRQLK
ncbi:MAG: hypothetical protein QXQ92_06180 [Candidatus Nezhaarchaeales archaeon]